jgi:hypothetical protein
VNDGVSTTTGDDPLHFFIAVVDLLVFDIGRNEREVTRSWLMSLGAVWSTHDCAEIVGGLDNGV